MYDVRYEKSLTNVMRSNEAYGFSWMWMWMWKTPQGAELYCSSTTIFDASLIEYESKWTMALENTR